MGATVTRQQCLFLRSPCVWELAEVQPQGVPLQATVVAGTEVGLILRIHCFTAFGSKNLHVCLRLSRVFRRCLNVIRI